MSKRYAVAVPLMSIEMVAAAADRLPAASIAFALTSLVMFTLPATGVKVTTELLGSERVNNEVTSTVPWNSFAVAASAPTFTLITPPVAVPPANTPFVDTGAALSMVVNEMSVGALAGDTLSKV